MAFSLILLVAFRTGVLTPQFAFGPQEGPYGLSWLSRPDIRFALGLDGLSLWLFLLTALLMITAVFVVLGGDQRTGSALLCLSAGARDGAAGALRQSRRGALLHLLRVHADSAVLPDRTVGRSASGSGHRSRSFSTRWRAACLTLLGVIALVVVHYRYSPANVLTFSIPELTRGLATLPWPRWHEVGSWSSPQVLIFLLLLAGFAIKVPMFPFHTWLPLAHVEAPTAGSIILAGVLLKVGSYGLLRFNMGMTPLGAVESLPSAGDPGGDRHHLRRPGRTGSDGHQATGGL